MIEIGLSLNYEINILFYFSNIFNISYIFLQSYAGLFVILSK